MATVSNPTMSRRRIATYGKAARRRIPDYNGLSKLTSPSPEKRKAASGRTGRLDETVVFRTGDEEQDSIWDPPADEAPVRAMKRTKPSAPKLSRGESKPTVQTSGSKTTSSDATAKASSGEEQDSIWDPPTDEAPARALKRVKPSAPKPSRGEPKPTVQTFGNKATPRDATAKGSVEPALASSTIPPITKVQPLARPQKRLPRLESPEPRSVAPPPVADDTFPVSNSVDTEVSHTRKHGRPPGPKTVRVLLDNPIAHRPVKMKKPPPTTTLERPVKTGNPPVRVTKKTKPTSRTPSASSRSSMSAILDESFTASPRASPPGLSPKRKQMWDELFNQEVEDLTQNTTRLSPNHDDNGDTLDLKPRRRLIDSLAPQLDFTDEVEDLSVSFHAYSQGSPPKKESPQAATKQINVRMKTALSGMGKIQPKSTRTEAVPLVQISGPKFTYGSQRSLLSEKSAIDDMDFSIPLTSVADVDNRKPRRVSLDALKSLPGSQEFDLDGDDGPPTAFRSVHELRQAGANKRFMDEAEDNLDQIGKPVAPYSSDRRTGMLHLLERMKDKAFFRQFLDNGLEQRLFTQLGRETDIIAGTLAMYLLVMILSEKGTPHTVAQFRQHGVPRLILRLIEHTESLTSISKQRTSNISKSTQKQIAESSAVISKLSLWDHTEVPALTPRTASLKCLEIMVQKLREAGDAGDVMSKELCTKVFGILKQTVRSPPDDISLIRQEVDFELALSTLQLHAIKPEGSFDDSIWIREYIPILSDVLSYLSSDKTRRSWPLQDIALKMALNVTNNSAKASTAFASEKLVVLLCKSVVTDFRLVSGFLLEDERPEVMAHLMLVTLLMMNVMEHSSSARQQLQNLQGSQDDPLEGMVKIFVERQEMASEVGFSIF